MDSHAFECYVKAGKICSEARSYGVSLITPGASILVVNKAVEAKIRELGGELAFPVQISVNHVAAHYCPDPDDDTAFKEGDLCKLDLGVHIDGYIADTAITVDLGDNAALVKASKDACDAALALIKPGVPFRALGRAIQDTITAAGFAPIKNLGGHGLSQFTIHDSLINVPNYDNHDETLIAEGMAFAVEPFATTGKGMVAEQNQGNIYCFAQRKPVRNPYGRKVLDQVERFHGLPFTTHQLTIPQKAAEMGLRELLANGAVHAYPPLVEVQKGFVSQHEHTVIIHNGKALITTR